MKKFIFTFLASLFLIGTASAQEGEIKTLFSGDYQHIGGFGSFDMKVTPVNGDIEMLTGGKGGIIINRSVVLGAGGFGLSTINRFNGLENNDYKRLETDFGYGGLYMAFLTSSNKPVHFSFPLLVGAGGVELNKKSSYVNEYTRNVERSAFFVAEPGVNVEFNMVKYFRFTVGGSYRFVAGTDLENLDDKDLSEWSINFGLKFGWF